MLKNKLVSVPGKYGLLGGVFSISTFFLMLALDRKPMVNTSMLLVDGLLLAVFIWFATKEFKDWNSGELRFWQGMTVGFGVYILTSILFALFIGLNFSIINPDYLDIYKQEAADILRRSATLYPDTFTEEVLGKQLTDLEQVTVFMLIASVFMKKIFIGMLISPIVSIILRK